MLRSELGDYCDAYIVGKGAITLEEDDNRDIKKGLQHLKVIFHLLIAY